MPSDGSPWDAPWFGRDAHLGRTLDALAEWTALAVTGPFGVGKSRLLDAVAAVWTGPVVRVDLADLFHPDAVRARLADAIGAPSADDPAIAIHLGEALAVLDNAEDAAQILGPLVRTWAASAPGARFLVASRIRVPDLHSWPLGPLDPTAAVALFRDRWTSAWGPSELSQADLLELVAALDHNPLTLVVAARHGRMYPSETLAARLLDPSGPLAATIGASWERLDPTAREALAACTVFAGAFDVDDARAVTGAPLEVLETLLDASMVHLLRPGWMRLDHAIRRFAAPHAPRGVGDRHADRVLTVGERVVPARKDGDWSALLALRHDLDAVAARGGAPAVRAAILLAELALGPGPLTDPLRDLSDIPAELEVRVAVLRSRICWRRGDPAAAHTVLQGVSPRTPAERFDVQYGLAVTAMTLGRWAELTAALPALEELTGDVAPFRAARVCILRFGLCARSGDVAGALDALHVARGRLIGHDPDGTLTAALDVNAGILLGQEVPERALALLERAAATFGAAGDLRSQASALRFLASTRLDLGTLDVALLGAEGAVALSERAGDRDHEVASRLVAVGVYLVQRRFDAAEAELTRTRTAAGAGATPPLIRAHEALLAHLVGRTEEARAGYELALSEPWPMYIASSVFHWRVCAALLRGDRAGPVLEGLATEAVSLGRVPQLQVRMAREFLAGGLTPATRQEALDTPQSTVALLRVLTEGGLRVGADGDWFARGAADVVDLRRRPTLQRVLAALARAGVGGLVRREALLSAGWPDQRVDNTGADARLYMAINTLRKLGLGEDLVTGDRDGLAYGLGPATTVVHSAWPVSAQPII